MSPMTFRHRFSTSVNQGDRFKIKCQGLGGDKYSVPPTYSDNPSRSPRNHTLQKNRKKQVEDTEECINANQRKIIVLDTSVLVHEPESLDILRSDDNLLAIPWIVLEELDQLKNKPNIGWDAREVIRRIEELAGSHSDCVRIEPRPSNKYFKTDLQKDKADHQIIATARALQAGPNCKTDVLLMSRDTIVRLLARELGIKSEDYPYNQVNGVFHSCLKRINVPEEDLPETGATFEHTCQSHEPWQHNEGVVCWSTGRGALGGIVFSPLQGGPLQNHSFRHRRTWTAAFLARQQRERDRQT